MAMNQILDFFQPMNQYSIIPKLGIGLGALCFVGLISRTNSYLSQRALNRLYGSTTWNRSEEIIVVTGGSSGIGAAIVKELATRGTKVIIFDINEPQEQLRSNIFFYKVDLASYEEIKEIVAQVRSDHGDPTVLINNAGVEFNKPILSLPETQLRKTFEVNIISNFLLVQEVLPAMVSRNHGHVVTVASLASFTTNASNVDYACTKSAALAFHEGLSQELRHVYNAPGVHTTIVHPAWVRTPMIKKMVASGVFDGQIIEPKDVAEVTVDQLMLDSGAQLFVPSSHWMVSMVRGFPSWLQESIRNQLSIKRLKALN
ncbi:NAD(P)-binding protein [Penicillium angulare]|uniref:NAD(P)-binding protein n=1 Tax=Penicillium angulare TaxID=116970 RepID=UPI00253F74D4|nr:NAD(P)-binding protein [Penicillium angulare]KAJ5287058.1 NAD(P)-binding protein [Penicillium angulare]